MIQKKKGALNFYMILAKQYQQNHEYDIRTIQFYDLAVLIEEEQWNVIFNL